MNDKDLETDGCGSMLSVESGYFSKSFPDPMDSRCELESAHVSELDETHDQFTNLDLKNDDRRSSFETTDRQDCQERHHKEEVQERPTAKQKEHRKKQLTRDVITMYASDEDGDNQLHISIIQEMIPISIYIISHAPNQSWLNVPNNLLQTALHLAVIMRLQEVVRRLLRSKADSEARDHNGDTPLHIASRKGYDEIVTTLVPYIGNLNSKNYNGQTSMHVAAEGTHLPVLRILAGKGADVNSRDSKSGRTILHYAAETGNRTLLDYVLQIPNIDVNVETYAGFTPVMLAHGKGYSDVVVKLEQSGAKLEKRDLSSESDSDG